MDRVEIHINALKDIDAIEPVDEDAHSDILALMAQMESDPGLQDMLLQRNYSEELLSVRSWEAQYKKGNNLYRLKQITPEGFAASKYRIIYAYMIPGQISPVAEYWILAVVHRDSFNYEDDNEYTKRIIKDYQSLLW